MVSYKIDMKMHLLKQTIKFIVPRILRFSGGVQAKTLQSRLVERVWARLEDVVMKEVETGCWNDRNFSNLLEATKKGLIFLCEYDRYYKRWLGLVSMFLAEEVLKEKRDFTYEQAVECAARPLMLTREEFEKHKDSLFELYMTGYLYGLSLLPQEDIDKIKKARVEHTDVTLPSFDGEAFFKLFFAERFDPHDKEKRKE